eukprot:scaffold54422_cov16-Prasinocladus_malaysianus.AAC.1
MDGRRNCQLCWLADLRAISSTDCHLRQVSSAELCERVFLWQQPVELCQQPVRLILQGLCKSDCWHCQPHAGLLAACAVRMPKFGGFTLHIL